MQKVCNCIHYRIPLELLLEENRSTSAMRLTGEANQYGMVFNSVRRLATSLPQPGLILTALEASGQLFESILLTLRDILFYYMGKVLLTPREQKRIPHPSDKRFFYVHSFSMVGREANKRAGIPANMPADFCRLEAPDRLHIVVDQLPSKEQK